MPSGDLVTRVASRYVDESLREFSGLMVSRLAFDPMIIAVFANLLLEKSGRQAVSSLTPVGIEPTEALHDMVTGAFLALDNDRDKAGTVAEMLLAAAMDHPGFAGLRPSRCIAGAHG